MEKRKKRICASVIAAAIILAVIAGVSFGGRQSAAERCFARNEKALLALAERFDAGERAALSAEGLRGIEQLQVHAKPDFLEFRTEAFGIAPASVYSGFYYSPQDVPLPFEEDAVLKQDGEGWSWQGVGDNGGYTCRMKKCWFYFEASY